MIVVGLIWQRLCEGYGYRTSTKVDALAEIAVQCWKALNPSPIALASSIREQSPSSSQRSNSVSSADIPLAELKKSNQTRTKAKRKTKDDATEVEEIPKIDLTKRFYNMIRDDEELYLRVLRYEVCPLMLSTPCPVLIACSRSLSTNWLVKPSQAVFPTKAGGSN